MAKLVSGSSLIAGLAAGSCVLVMNSVALDGVYGGLRDRGALSQIFTGRLYTQVLPSSGPAWNRN